MPNTPILSIIKQDYINLLMEHVILLVGDIEKIFKEYPEIEGFSFGEKRLIFQGTLMGKNQAVIIKNIGSYEKESWLKYYGYTQNASGQEVRLLNVLEECDTIFDAYYQIIINPYFKTLAIQNTYSDRFLKKDMQKSVVAFFGKDCAECWAAYKEKSLIEEVLDNKRVNKTTNLNNSELTKTRSKAVNKV